MKIRDLTGPARGLEINWAAVVSAVLLVHFLISAAIWLSCFFAVLKNPHMRSEFLPVMWRSVPAFALCAMSATVLVLALRGRQIVRRGVVLLIAVTVVAFAVDVYFGRWQIHTFIATSEYWKSGGREHDYFTWWWFNDRWFR